MFQKTIIDVKIQPRSSRQEIVGWVGSFLKIKLTSPPVENQANQELIKLLSKKLGISKSSITIITGQTSSIKKLKVSGLNKDEIISMLKIGD